MNVCIDCRAAWRRTAPPGTPFIPPFAPKPRPAPHPGPRCATHNREAKKATRKAAHARRVLDVYGLAPGEYDALVEIQGGLCAGCRRVKANGKGKRLAVDHDHSCCPGPTSCGRCVRGLLCHGCNDTLAHFRDDPGLLRGLAGYLERWPSYQLPGRELSD